MRQMCCCLQTVITCRCLTSSPVYEMNFETTRLHLDFLSTNYLELSSKGTIRMNRSNVSLSNIKLNVGVH